MLLLLLLLVVVVVVVAPSSALEARPCSMQEFLVAAAGLHAAVFGTYCGISSIVEYSIVRHVMQRCRERETSPTPSHVQAANYLPVVYMYRYTAVLLNSYRYWYRYRYYGS
eukprot:COSAG05_NODE_25_length_31349_cov_4.978560_17_plen_111_part_00